MGRAWWALELRNGWKAFAFSAEEAAGVEMEGVRGGLLWLVLGTHVGQHGGGGRLGKGEIKEAQKENGVKMPDFFQPPFFSVTI